MTVIPLHLRPGAREWFGRWLAGTYPALVPRYRELYAKGSYVQKAYRERLGERVAPLLRRHGLAPKTGYDPRGQEPPVPPQRDDAPAAEQLRLL